MSLRHDMNVGYYPLGMATRTFNFTRDQGVAFVDPKNKSRINAPYPECFDILNCGNNTHLRTTASGNTNYPVGLCQGTATYMGVSYRTAFEIAPVVSVNNVQITAMANALPNSALVRYMAAYAASTPFNPILSPEGFIGDNFVGFTLKSGVWSTTETITGVDRILRITIPGITPVFDACGNQVAFSVKGNATFIYKDLDCKEHILRSERVAITYGASKPSPLAPDSFRAL